MSENYEEDFDQRDSPEINSEDFPIEQEEQEPEIEIVEEDAQDAGDGFGSDQDEPAQEEAPVEKAAKPKHRVPAKTRINQLIRQKSQAEHEANLLRSENERLRQLSEVSNNAAMTHYDKSVKLRLDRAIQMKTEALHNEDIEAQVKADLEMSRVAAQIEQLEAWKAQQGNVKQQQPQQQQQYDAPNNYQEPTQQLNEVTENWLAENSWFVPNSPDYDPDMQEEVQAFADSLDKKLRRTGQANKILSEDYFNEINNYVAREFYGEQPQQRSNKGNLTMKPANTRAPVAPVSRGGQPSNPQKPTRVTLTTEERDLARMSGITPEAYAKWKVETQKIQRDRGRN